MIYRCIGVVVSVLNLISKRIRSNPAKAKTHVLPLQNVVFKVENVYK